MCLFPLIFFIWVLFSDSMITAPAYWCPYDFIKLQNRKFEQKTYRFFEFQDQTNSWAEVELPYDLVSCINENCNKVGSIVGTNNQKEQNPEKVSSDTKKRKESSNKNDGNGGLEDSYDLVLPLRKLISLTKMSEISIWVTGISGSIYERFWNGVQWIIAPHDLPLSAGSAISVFIVNQTILALSESGILYQMTLSETSEPVWIELTPILHQSSGGEGEENPQILIKSGVVSHDGMKVYFCTKDRTLLELIEVEPPRWVFHGRPPGANVAAIADAGTVRKDVVYTISCIGDLYEYDRRSRPSWKKHIKKESLPEDASLMPATGITLHGLSGHHSISLFLLTKNGNLVERRLYQRKWKWVVHGSPKDQHLTSIAKVMQEDSDDKLVSLFFTSSSGSIFEHQISKRAGTTAQGNQVSEPWVSHMYPQHTKVARGIAGLQFQAGRVLFPLDDGRLAELHLPGIGGENSGPLHQSNWRRKATNKYVWTILDAPESEGWNAEYCTDEHGPTNCMTGTKYETNNLGATRRPTANRRRKGSQTNQDYFPPGSTSMGLTKPFDEYSLPDNWINTNFHLRVMEGGRSFFLITDNGFTFEYLNTENVWIWLRHEHSTAIKGALGNYNGSLYAVDSYGSLLIRERSSTILSWINCTALKRGRQVIGGPPWDGMSGQAMKVTPEDSLFFVSRNGRLLQFTVALRKFKWKDCRNPPNTKVASMVDQELFRENIVFVIGRNGRLYQYNKVTELWHEHYQSQHMTLSRVPGTAMRQSSQSLTGSLFMLSEDGGLIEYHWNSLEGWNWVEHGTPDKGVTLVGSPGPSFEGNQIFLIGSDRNVYLRYMDQMTWKWKNCGCPCMGNWNFEDQIQKGSGDDYKKQGFCIDENLVASSLKDSELSSSNCDPRVAFIRPISFSEGSIIFVLIDGRLAEMLRIEGTHWIWSRIIGTPASLCLANYWTALAS